MRNIKFLSVFFAVLALQAYCNSNPVWNEQALSIKPILFNTVEIIPDPPIYTIVDLLTGPAPNTNLLCLGARHGISNETNIISIFNTTSLASIREFLDIGSFYPLDTVAVVSLPGSVFYTAVITNRKGFKQILGFPMLSDDYFPDLIQVTTNSMDHVNYKVHQILAHSINPVIIYDEQNHDETSLYATLIDTKQKIANQRIHIVSGKVQNLTCALSLDSTNILCLYKQGKNLYRALISLTDTNSKPVLAKIASDNSTDENITFTPLAVIANKGYFAHFTARQKAQKTEMIARVFDLNDKTTDVADTFAQAEPLKTFDFSDIRPLQGLLPHGSDIAAYYRELDASGNQVWYYRVYNKALTAVGDEMKIAEVPGIDSGFRVARETGNGAVNIAAHTVVTWHGAYVLNLYYGQILSSTPL